MFRKMGAEIERAGVLEYSEVGQVRHYGWYAVCQLTTKEIESVGLRRRHPETFPAAEQRLHSKPQKTP